MSAPTRYLSKLIGLYSMLVALSMITHRERTLLTVTAMLHDAPMMLMLGVITLASGLAIVLAHNIWSGSKPAVIVTIIGWLTLIKGLLFLSLSPEAEADFLLRSLHYDQLFHLYMAIAIGVGAYLTYAGFKATSR